MAYDIAGGAVAALMIWMPMWMASNAPRPQEPVAPAAIVAPQSSDALTEPGPPTPDSSATTQAPAAPTP